MEVSTAGDIVGEYRGSEKAGRKLQKGGPSMRLVCCGAAHEVTGSCHFLEVGPTKLLVDCGMEQGVNLYENLEPPVPYSCLLYTSPSPRD